MERATQKDQRGYYLVGDGIYSDWGAPEKFRGDNVDRLAAYEDTGLEPADIISAADMAKIACALHELNAYKELGSIDRLCELAQADKRGENPNFIRWKRKIVRNLRKLPASSRT